MNIVNLNENTAMVTCSYRPDFERCSRLCASMDEFISPEVQQVIIVPSRDRKLFSQLESGTRSIVSTEDALPARYFQLPYFKKWWLDQGLWPIRGWMMQQVTKLSADLVTNRETIIFVDSDIEFIRSLQYQRFIIGDTVRLHRKPMHKRDGVHLKWHHASADLLGLRQQYFGSDYIGPLATWRRSNLIQLKNHIEKMSGCPWYEAVGRRMTVSEYTLYGVFVEHVIGIDKSGHFANAEDLCHCLWFENDTEKFLTEFNYKNSPQAVLLQSNIGLNQGDVESMMVKLRQNLATC